MNSAKRDEEDSKFQRTKIERMWKGMIQDRRGTAADNGNVSCIARISKLIQNASVFDFSIKAPACPESISASSNLMLSPLQIICTPHMLQRSQYTQDQTTNPRSQNPSGNPNIRRVSFHVRLSTYAFPHTPLPTLHRNNTNLNQDTAPPAQFFQLQLW